MAALIGWCGGRWDIDARLTVKTAAGRCGLAVAVLLAVGLVAGPSQAADSTWSGTSGDGLWPTLANWSAGVPGTTTSVTTGGNVDIVTFDTATNLAVNYGTSSRNIGGIQFGSGAGPFVVSRPGFNSTRLYFSLGGEVVVVPGVTEPQALGRTGLAGTTGTYTFRNDSTTPTAKIDFATSFSSASTGATTLVLTGTNPGGASGVTETSRLNAISEAAGAGAMTLVKDGTGNWLLEGSNTYTGGTTINDGSLLLRGSATLGHRDRRHGQPRRQRSDRDAAGKPHDQRRRVGLEWAVDHEPRHRATHARRREHLHGPDRRAGGRAGREWFH